jgi:hypothetical protein
VFVARKVGAPGHSELGIGAIAEGGGTVANRTALQALGLSLDQFERLVVREREELERRVRRYRGDRPLPDIEGRDVVLVDDGLATGVTAEAALRALRSQGPRRLVLAIPVCARASILLRSSGLSASGTRHSARPPTTKYSTCSPAPTPRRDHGDDRRSAPGRDYLLLEPMDIYSARSSIFNVLPS